VHETDFLRSRGVESHAGEEQFARRRLADPPQDERRNHRRHDPELHLRETENGVIDGHGDVTDGRQAGAAAQRGTLDAANERDGQGIERAVHRRRGGGIAHVLVVGVGDDFRHPREVGAGAEHLARAAQHCHADVSILRDGAGPIGQLGNHRFVEGVSHVRAIEREPRDRSVPLGQEIVVGHGTTCGTRRTSATESAR
jgi:hypothetical protein